jgi:hypothetical protein
MTEPTSDAVLQRLARLERTVRRWQVVGGVAVALLALAALMGAVGRPDVEGTEEIRAKAFVLVDRDGRPRMDLRVARNDSTHLVLLDREGLPRLSLNVLAQGGTDIVLRDQQGLPRAALSALPDGRPGLSLYDATGTTRASLGMFPGDKTMLVLYDTRGRALGFIPQEP